jgi:hypothetical protein
LAKTLCNTTVKLDDGSYKVKCDDDSIKPPNPGHYKDATKTATYDDLKKNWDTEGELVKCTRPDDSVQDHSCEAKADDKDLVCGKMVLSKTVADGADAVSTTYELTCVYSDSCSKEGMEVEIADGKVDITCYAFRLMATTVGALATILLSM